MHASGGPERRIVELNQHAFTLLGQQGNVTVRDFPAMTVVSICVWGSYSVENYESDLNKLQEWPKNQSKFKQDGPPRLLACNSPFIPWFLKIAEVQIPVTVNQ